MTATTGTNANVLDRVPAFTGRSPGGGPITSIFDLAEQDLSGQATGLAQACQDLAQPGGLVGHGNYVALRLHVGVQPRPDGDRGWVVTGLAVGNGALRLEPRSAPDLQGFERVLPVLDGAPKRFLASVANDGPVGDHASLELAPDSPIAFVEAANGLVMLHGRKAVDEAARLYAKAAAIEPRDAMERLDVDTAKKELE